jgi:hypothetical protein
MHSTGNNVHVSFFCYFFIHKDKEALRNEKQRKIAEEEKLSPYFLCCTVIPAEQKEE